MRQGVQQDLQTGLRAEKVLGNESQNPGSLWPLGKRVPSNQLAQPLTLSALAKEVGMQVRLTPPLASSHLAMNLNTG